MSLVLKDPLSALDYRVEWGVSYLANDTLAGSSWSVVPLEAQGITIDGSRFDADSATVEVSGGQPGKIYRLLNHIVTVSGREDVRSLTIRVERR